MGIAAALALLAGLSAARSAARPTRRVVERAAALPAGARSLGRLPADRPVRGAVVLRPRDPRALTTFIARVSDPRSPAFGDYLPAGAFGSRFGPTAAARDAVVHALRSAGLGVAPPTGDDLLVAFHGSAADTERLFGTSLRAVALPGGGQGRVTTSSATLPGPVAGDVAAVIGLDETAVAHRIGAGSAGHPAAAGGHPAARGDAPATTTPPSAPHACPAAQTAAQRFGGLTDDAIARAYGADGLYSAGDTGAGQRIAIYELEPFLRSDVRTFDRCYFGAAAAQRMAGRLHVVDVDGGPPHGTGSGEASLDVEDISALAPGARIDVYVGPSANAYDSLDEYAAIVDADSDRVVSTSWGLCEQAVQKGQPGFQEAENLLFQQAAAQGQTIFAAAGDQGSDDCNGSRAPTPGLGQDPVSVDDPGTQPYAVSVGGTAIDDARTSDPLEHAWNDGAAWGAGGGGISMSWAMPAWQRAARLPGIARPGGRAYREGARVQARTGFPTGFCDAGGAQPRGTPCRLVPDVSAQADEFTGAITVYSRANRTARHPSGWTTTGGTSSAAPIWAATLALVNASPSCRARPATREGVGFVSPLLYALASTPTTYAQSFTDVRTGDNDVYGLANGQVWAAGRGYDMATGLGSPRLAGPDGQAGLAADACAAAGGGARPQVSRLSPATAPTTGGTRLVVHGRGFAAGGRSRVAAVQVGTVRVGPADIRVRDARSLDVILPPGRRALPPASTPGQDGSGPAVVTVTLRDGETSAPGPRTVLHYLHRGAVHFVPTVGAVSPAGGPRAHPSPVTILGSGFTHVTAVTFGGVRARHVHVDGPDRITVVPPPLTGRTHCVALPDHGIYRREGAADDICQVHVRVRDPHGASAEARIRAPYEGQQVVDDEGDVVLPPHCGCEAAQAPDEFDYVPRPHVTSVSTTTGPLSLASEHGGTVITVHGRGLDPLTLDNADFGDPRLYSSQATGYVFASGTLMQIHAPARKLSAAPARVPFSVRTLGGRSNARTVTYAGLPAITRVVNADNPTNLHGIYGGPDTGRSPLVVHGRGMRGQVLGVEFAQPGHAQFSLGTQYHFRVGPGRVTTESVAQNPAVVGVELCTVTGCTRAGHHNLFWLYPPGDPQVSSVSPASGPAAGGTVVTVTGHNLGCALSVSFGTIASPTVAPVKTILPCGSTQTLSATAPPGTAGVTVPVAVQTAEGFYTHAPVATTGRFAYR